MASQIEIGDIPLLKSIYYMRILEAFVSSQTSSILKVVQQCLMFQYYIVSNILSTSSLFRYEQTITILLILFCKIKKGRK